MYSPTGVAAAYDLLTEDPGFSHSSERAEPGKAP